MKRIISILILLGMLISFVACGKGDATEEPSANSNEAEDTSATDDNGSSFKVGFARMDMTPSEDSLYKIPTSDSRASTFNWIRDPLYATCIAVSDGKKTAMLITLDTKHATDYLVNNMRSRIQHATGILPGDIIVSVTHNHSSPDPANQSNIYIKGWLLDFFSKVGDLAKEAVADLSPAEVYTGTSDTTGLAFVRRYLHEDGTYSSIQNVKLSTTPIVAHETEADSTMQLIKFAREGKKDVVLVNWQAHVAHAIGYYPSSITSDFVYFLRNTAERQNDIYLAYFQGASGNINFTVRIKELNKINGDYTEAGFALARRVNELLPKMTKVESGDIFSSVDYVEAVVRKDSEERVAQAKEIINSEYDEDLIKEYGFASKYDVNATYSRAGMPYSKKIIVSAITFGDLAFVAVPYEMFDTNGMEVKNGSPYKMTFVLTCANGSWGYIPSNFAFPHGGYEVSVSKFVRGTGEQFSSKYVEMLKELKEQS